MWCIMMSIWCKILFCGRHLSSITVRLTQKYFDNNFWLIISITSDSYLTYSILLDKFSSKVCTYCYHIINFCNNIFNIAPVSNFLYVQPKIYLHKCVSLCIANAKIISVQYKWHICRTLHGRHHQWDSRSAFQAFIATFKEEVIRQSFEVFDKQTNSMFNQAWMLRYSFEHREN